MKNINEKINQISHLRASGRIEEAYNLAKKVILKQSKNPFLNLEIGLILLIKKNYIEAIKYLEVANKFHKNDEIQKQIVNGYLNLKDFSKAKVLNEEILSRSPDSQEILMLQAKIHKEMNEFDLASNIYEKILNKSFSIEVATQYGFLLNSIKEYIKAKDIYEMILAKNEYLPAIYNLGIVYTNLKEYKKAEEAFNKAIRINSKIDDFWFARSIAKLNQFKINEAISDLEQIKEINPNNKYASYQMAVIYGNIGDDSKAKKLYLDSLSDKAHENIEILFRLGLMGFRRKEFKEAMQYWSSRIDANERYKNFDDKRIEEIFKEKDEIAIHRDQGLGDELIFLRVMEDLLSKYNKKYYYLCHDKLYDLLNFNLKGIKVIKEYEAEEILNNKKIAKVTVGSILSMVDNPIASVKKAKKFETKKSLTEKLKRKYKKDDKRLIGLSWKSKNEAIGDYKSIPIESFESLFLDKNNVLINLQYGDVRKEIEEVKKKYGVEIKEAEEVDCMNDLFALTSLIEACDYIVTCSNVTAHLSGWLEKKTYLLLPKNLGKLWYWNHQDKEKSEWYPCVKIFNQSVNGLWKEEVNRITKEISQEGKFINL